MLLFLFKIRPVCYLNFEVRTERVIALQIIPYVYMYAFYLGSCQENLWNDTQRLWKLRYEKKGHN